MGAKSLLILGRRGPDTCSTIRRLLRAPLRHAKFNNRVSTRGQQTECPGGPGGPGVPSLPARPTTPEGPQRPLTPAWEKGRVRHGRRLIFSTSITNDCHITGFAECLVTTMEGTEKLHCPTSISTHQLRFNAPTPSPPACYLGTYVLMLVQVPESFGLLYDLLRGLALQMRRLLCSCAADLERRRLALV
jgi:hypothetical protein